MCTVWLCITQLDVGFLYHGFIRDGVETGGSRKAAVGWRLC